MEMPKRILNNARTLFSRVNSVSVVPIMNIFKNGFPLHKLYGFLLLNTSLIVLTPVMLGLFSLSNKKDIPVEIVITFGLSLCGVILSVLFILRKRIAINLLSVLLIAAIIVLTIFMFEVLGSMNNAGWRAIAMTINAFAFFMAEGVLGLLIIHSRKLSEEFEIYD